MRLPFKYQIALAPLIIIVLLLALIVFTLYHLNAIREENEAVREWTRILQHVSSALQGAINLDQVAGYIDTLQDVRDIDEFHFRYLDLYRQVSEDLEYPELLERLSPQTRRFIAERQAEIRYQEPLDTDSVRIALAELIPRLQALHSNYFAEKRYAFTVYYRNVNAITDRLGMVAMAVLVLCVLIGVLGSLWAVLSTRSRLRALALQAGALCDGAQGPVRDELDQLAQCMRSMTRRLVDGVAAQKLLEGAEHERRRIAMDMHDQTLTDITGLMRELRELRDAAGVSADAAGRVEGVALGLDDLARSIRRVIDDLHPQTLEMLGLEPALRSYLEKRLSGAEQPHFFLKIGAGINALLSDMQRLSLYRIVIEAAHNIVRHAHASCYEIECRLLDNMLVLVIEDNGVGMRRSALPDTRGHGVNNIEQRATAVGAQLNWGRSRFSSGTRLELRLELERAGDQGFAVNAEEQTHG